MQTVWEWLPAIYLFLGGLGAGAFLVAATLEFSGKREEFDLCPITLAGAILPGPLVALGTVLLIFDLGADSMQSLELVAAFEEEFDIEMDEDKALEVQTVGNAADFIAEYLH